MSTLIHHTDHGTCLEACLRLHHEPDLSHVTRAALLKSFTDPTDMFRVSASLLRECAPTLTHAQAIRLTQPAQESIEHAILASKHWARQPDCHIVTWASPHYPDSLKHLTDPPALLYVQGSLDCFTKPIIAMVGSRRASPYGVRVAHRLACDLAHAGFCVVSGLAIGIDAAAHVGAMTSQQPHATFAVLGHGLTRLYPASHRPLARQILRTQGALMTEYAPECNVHATHFPQRNRLVAGLCLGVVVVQAALRSGSLITARLANEAGKEVFAVPGPIGCPQSTGVHALIQQGACLVESAQDVLRELAY